MLRWEQVRPYNAVHIVELRNLQLTKDRLQAGLDACLRTTGLCDVQFDRKGKTLTLNSTGATSPVEHFASGHADDSDLSARMTDQLSIPFPEAAGCPIRVQLIDKSDDVQYVVLAYRHTVADAQSSVLILNAILNHCRTGSRNELLDGWNVAELRQLFRKETGWRQWFGRNRKLATELLHGLSCVRPLGSSPNNTREVCLIHDTNLETAQLKAAARTYGVSIQDFLMAAQVEAFAEVFGDSSRFDLKPSDLLAVTSMMDLRRHASGCLDNAIGQFLGMVSVRPSVSHAKTFASLVKFVSSRNADAKNKREFFWSINSMSLMARIWDRLPLSVNRDLARKLYPFVSALSNVNLGPPIVKEVEDGVVTNYFRGANLGVMVPLVLSNTTVGDQFNLCTTHKDAVYTEDEVRQLVQCVRRRIHSA